MSSSYRVRSPADAEVRERLARHPELLQNLLSSRGIATDTDAEAFLSPDYDAHTHDPFLMKDMDRAATRILKAISENERVVIYSDYDTDGIPGGVILHDFFKKIGFANFTNYIPHRHHEGYGLNAEAIEQFIGEDIDVLITIDCGSADAEHVSRAAEHGIDVIICDHHEVPSEDGLAAHALLNPKREGETYPFRELCGSGIVYKFVQALARRLPTSTIQLPAPVPLGWEKWLLDLVAIATVSDMVPLVGENRVLACYGLQVLKKTRRLGLTQLLSDLRINRRHITEDDIGFMIGPRINAASRMSVPGEAFRLLATDDPIEARELSARLQKLNDERKGIVASMVKDIRTRIAARQAMGNVLVAGDPRWRPSLLGLAANTLMEEYERPVFLWGRADSPTIKGSCRSDGSVNLVQLMEHASHTFIEYGGHAFSGGFSVDHERVHTLEEVLSEAYAAVERQAERKTQCLVDGHLTLDDVNWRTAQQIYKLAPFGIGNSKPVFLFSNVAPASVSSFGKDRNHLRVDFTNGAGERVHAIAFFADADSFTVPLREGKEITLVAHLEESHFRGRGELRLRIVDIIR